MIVGRKRPTKVTRVAMHQRPGQRSDAVRLLVVDAEPVRQAIAEDAFRLLLERPELITSAAGRPALDLLRRIPFDLVLLDLESVLDLAALPEEAVGRLVKAAEGALIITLSDDPSVSAAVALMRAGVHDVAVRPITARELSTRLVRLAQRHGREALLGNAAAVTAMAREANELAEASGRMEAVGELVGWPGDLGQLRLMLQQAGATALRSELEAVAETARDMPPVRPAILPMWQQEQRIIEEAIASFAGNIALAAAALELSPSTIYRKRQAWAAAESSKGAA